MVCGLSRRPTIHVGGTLEPGDVAEVVTEEVGTGDQGLETGEDWHDQINFGYGYLRYRRDRVDLLSISGGVDLIVRYGICVVQVDYLTDDSYFVRMDVVQCFQDELF